MIPYFLLFTIILLLAGFEQIYDGPKIKPLVWLVGILLVAFAAFRPENIDKDYANYVNSFKQFEAPLDYFRYFDDWAFFEPLYYFIPSLLKTYFTTSYYIPLTFFLFAAFGVSLKLTGIGKLSNFFFLTVLCYFSHFYLLHEMTQIRAAIASGSLLLLIPIVQKKKHLLAILIIALTCLLHYSALFLLLLLFLNPTNSKPKLYWSLLGATLVLAFIDTSFVFSYLSFDLGPITLKSTSYQTLTESG